MSSQEQPQPPIEIPVSAIQPATLRNLVEAFVLREGTDYGAHEINHEKKVEQVMKQIESERVKIFFDPNSESVTLVPVS